MTNAMISEETLLKTLSTLNLSCAPEKQISPELLAQTETCFPELASLADSNHVLLRALIPLQQVAQSTGRDALASHCNSRIEQEHHRIANAVQQLFQITRALESSGCPTTVIKTLEHWPDFGNDLDLYTTASATKVCEVMTSHFGAHIEPQSWGDRLASKWNFTLPGLPELIEIHAQRLGQTGEHTTMARRFVSRRVKKSVLGFEFAVPAPEERIIVATLQRMYRHFYFRICDVVNIAALVESGAVDFVELHRAASIGGIWKGVCSLLRIVSDYILAYRGTPVMLPVGVVEDATFGGEKVFLKSRFIRIPILPEGAHLYSAQVANTALRGDVAGTLRLSLLPYLASAAAISYKFTGSDKGIW